jgi:large subunit ribosomal protein L21
MTIYAVVQTGSKQYLVREGDTIRVESLPHEQGETIELKDVRLLSKDGQVTVGNPSVKSAKVTAKVSKNGLGEKVVIFKYKSKTRNRRKKGHRQGFTELKVTGIKA